MLLEKSKKAKKKAPPQRVPSNDDHKPITSVHAPKVVSEPAGVGRSPLCTSEPFFWESFHDENALQQFVSHNFERREERPKLIPDKPMWAASKDGLDTDQVITSQLNSLKFFVTSFETRMNRGNGDISATDLWCAGFYGLICLAYGYEDLPANVVENFHREVDRFEALLKRLLERTGSAKPAQRDFDPGYKAFDQSMVSQEALAKKEEEFNQIRRSKDEELAKQKADLDAKQKQIDNAKKKLSKQEKQIQELTQKLKKSDEEKRKLRVEIDALKAAPQRDPEQEKRLSGKLIAQMTASQSQLDWRVAKLKLLHQKELSALQ